MSPKILLEIYQQNNQALPEVKALTAERLRKCRSRINQAVRDGCLERYLADFIAAVQKAQSTPFLRGEGARGWRASFDWFVANQVNVYAVLEGKYDGPARAGGTMEAEMKQCQNLMRLAADPGERVEAIRFTSPASEPVCSLCDGTGWRRAGNEDLRYRRCECVKARLVAARLVRFRRCFEGPLSNPISRGTCSRSGQWL